MIVVQTPLRISFFGGGTDFRGFYAREEGVVLSSTIDKYLFVIIKERFDDDIRVGYTKTELVSRVEDLQHDLVREALKMTGIQSCVEISTMGDIPSRGSGLGSSGSVTVGLLQAMYMHRGLLADAETLAQQACDIEIGILQRPIGKQDQYIAAYGGLKMLHFMPNEQVRVEPVEIDARRRRELSANMLLFYTGITRDASSVLAEQVENLEARTAVLREMRDMASEARNYLLSGSLDRFGELLHTAWECKKKLASKITNGTIEAMYSAAREAGAIGGKICGAGGGGFLLLYCPVVRQAAVRAALQDYRELPFALEPDGSKVILNYRRA